MEEFVETVSVNKKEAVLSPSDMKETSFANEGETGKSKGDRAFKWFTCLAALSVLFVVVAIVGSLVEGALPSIRAFGLNFFETSDWDPVAQRFGALVPIFGTIVTSAIALLIAIPVSF